MTVHLSVVVQVDDWSHVARLFFGSHVIMRAQGALKKKSGLWRYKFFSAFPRNSREINETRKGVNHPVIIIHHDTTFHVPVSNNKQVFGSSMTNDDDRVVNTFTFH